MEKSIFEELININNSQHKIVVTKGINKFHTSILMKKRYPEKRKNPELQINAISLTIIRITLYISIPEKCEKSISCKFTVSGKPKLCIKITKITKGNLR